jgi:exodeoxyribonuclease VII large subunit
VRADLLATARQLVLRADQAVLRYLDQRAERLAAHARLLPQVRDLVFHAGQYLDDKADRLRRALPQVIERSAQQLAVLAARFHPSVLLERTARETAQTAHLWQRLASATTVRVDRETQRVGSISRLLDSMHYQRVLERGFALVRAADGRVLTRRSAASAEPVLQVEFYDGTLMVRADDAAAAPIPRAKPRKTARMPEAGQPDLFSAPDAQEAE